jgi:integrase/recombinase XerD
VTPLCHTENKLHIIDGQFRYFGTTNSNNMSSFPKDKPPGPYRIVFVRSTTDLKGSKVHRRKTLYFPRTQFTRKQVLAIKSELDIKYKMGQFDPWYDQVDHLPVPVRHTTLMAAVQAYISYKSMYDWREDTARRYTEFFRSVLNDFGQFTQITELSTRLIMDFINRDTLAYESRKTYRRALVTFLSWCTENDYPHSVDIKELKIGHGAGLQEQSIRYLSSTEIQRLVAGITREIAGNIRAGYTKNNDAFVMIDFINWQRMTGMRVSETLSLRPGNINLSTWELSIGDKSFVTKSRKKQSLPIGDISRLRHIALRRIRRSDGGLLFRYTDPKRLSKKFKAYVRKYLPERGDIRVHDLRHTCAIELLRGGVGIYQVSRWMRHKSVSTTQRYADLLATDLARQVGSVFNG